MHQSAQICDECWSLLSECQAPTRAGEIVYVGKLIEVREKPLRQTAMVKNLYPLGLVKYIDVQDSLSHSKEKRDARKELSVSINTPVVLCNPSLITSLHC
jgi:hypothetical protein